MINGLNTGGFDLQDDNAAAEMTDRALTMLSQFLVSNQNLELNSTFKVYLKILSIERMKANPVKKVSRKRTYPMHVGASTIQKTYNPKWAFDIDLESFPLDQQVHLKDKCLLLAFILGFLQHVFYQSSGMDNRFVTLYGLKTKAKRSKEIALNLLNRELADLFSVTNIKQTGPYELKTTLKLLHETYKCQFFVFCGSSPTVNLNYMYPKEYDDTLMPIYLFQTLDEKHVIFISNLNYFIGSTKSFCFACKKTFKRRYNSHLCSVKEHCFTCRKFLQTKETFNFKLLKQNFCDKNITNEGLTKCSICNLSIYTKQCKDNHKKICCGKGNFGYYFDCCNRFVSGHDKEHLIASHHCRDDPICKFCYKSRDQDHLCRLKTDKFPKDIPRLAFMSIDFFKTNVLKDDCPNPCIALVWRETTERGNFQKYIVKNDSISTSSSAKFIFNYLPTILQKKPFQCKLLKKNSVLNLTLDKLKHSIESDCITNLLKLILDTNFTCTTYICQDSNSVISMAILKGLTSLGITPVIFRKGRNIILLEIVDLSIRFLNSPNYLPGNEDEISKLFEINHEEMYFPYNFLLPENIDYVGKIPDVKYFQTFSDDLHAIQRKKSFLSFWGEKPWSLSEQLLIFGNHKLSMLAQAHLSFCVECFALQDTFKTEKPLFKDHYIHPFSKPLCSISGFVYKFFKIYFLNDFEMYAINHEYGTPTRQVSQLEYEYVSYKEFMLKDQICLSAFNNKNGQKYFKESIPDLYSLTTNEAYFFCGDFYHAHYLNCPTNKNKTANSPHPFGGTYKDQNDKLFLKLTKLMETNPQIKKVHVIWECQFKEEKKSEAFKLFFDNFYIPHPLKRLRPRDCVRAALSDVYALKWSKEAFPEENFYCLDVNGLYSFCAVNFPYMTGKYNILMGKDINKLQFKNGHFHVDNNRVMGSILLTILAPSNLMHPFLPYRKKNGSVVLALCRDCAENENFDCICPEKYRAFTATYLLTEVEFALSLGYKILFVHEVHYYITFDYIFKQFVQKLNCLKIQATDCFKECQTNEEKSQLCDKINISMNLQNCDKITVESVHPNSKKRNIYKLMCNALFGKFIQNTNQAQPKYVTQQEDIESLFHSGKQIEDLFCINENLCLINLKANEFKLPVCRTHNAYIGAQVTSYARQVMYQHLLKVNAIQGAKIYQLECDSLFLSLPRTSSNILNVTPSLGDFKNVYDGEIVAYYSIGQKQYCINYLEHDNLKSVFKVSGVSLKNHYNSTQLTENTFETFLDEFIEGNNVHITFRQEKHGSDFTNFKVLSYQQKFTLTNKLSRKRFVNVFDKRMSTFPFGFKFY